MIDLVVIGAGAAGFFAAAQLISRKPDAQVLILEKTGKVLSKVKISGGGRCNVCPNCLDIDQLIQNYPRGNPWLREVLKQFSVSHILSWFQNEGVPIVAEADGRMFPKSNDSQTIVDTLQNATLSKGVKIRLLSGVKAIHQKGETFELLLDNEELILAKTILVATGGHPTERGFQMLTQMGLEISAPVPSLFTFNVPKHSWGDLKGISVANTRVKLEGTDLEFEGPLLITHWGFSGPAVLKLSAFSARILHEKEYRYQFSINWISDISTTMATDKLLSYQFENPKRKPDQWPLFDLPKRLWERICIESGLASHHNWAEVGKKKIQLTAQILTNSRFAGEGKTTFKEEFVTSGGVSLNQINPKTCESIQTPGLFFAGEVLDIDGITGGFNFQAAWSTGWVAATSIFNKLIQDE